MNPFDLRGPEFLGFYAMLGTVVIAALVYLRRRAEEPADGTRPPPHVLTDYLDIAFLRGGVPEALRVVTTTLIGRGLLEVVDDNRLRTRDPASIDRVPKATATERQVLRKFTEPGLPASLFADQSLRTIVTAACEPTLKEQGLLPNDDIRAARRALFLSALLVLGGTALTKIALALTRGRSNIAFLIVIAVLFVLIAFVVTHPRRTRAGDSMVRDLKQLFGGLHERSRAQATAFSGATNPTDATDMTLLAAVFGMGAIHASMPESRKLFPSGSGSSGDSGSTTGCGSSSSSSCGSSSGGDGGGGGGGCGGCGGSS